MTLIKTAIAVTGAVVLATIVTSQSAKAETIETIDCASDRNRAETTICSSQHLQILDAKITELYADIMYDRRVAASVKTNLRRSQYAFLSRRDACGTDYLCLNEVMTLRVARIRHQQ